MILYKFGILEDKLINIKEANKGFKYTCIECNTILIPHKGKIKEHHFKHQNYINCNNESYLHKTAKTIIYNKIKNNEDFIIEYEINSKINEFNFKDFEIEIEKNYQNFRPDLTLKKDSKIIFFEINVTHRCNKEKINLNIPIIEISISNENDLIKLINGKWSYSKATSTNFYNCKFQLHQKNKHHNYNYSKLKSNDCYREIILTHSNGVKSKMYIKDKKFNY